MPLTKNYSSQQYAVYTDIHHQLYIYLRMHIDKRSRLHHRSFMIDPTISASTNTSSRAIFGQYCYIFAPDDHI